MPRPKLDDNQIGHTPELRVRVPQAIRQAIEEALEPGEREASFVREAIDDLIAKRRGKHRPPPDTT